MNAPLRIFVGYDPREPIAYHVLTQSLIETAGCPISVTPLDQRVLRQAGIYTREAGPTESTAFSITRFLVPALCGFQGHALFLDCDMLVQSDITELWAWAIAYPRNAVWVCPHDYTPKTATKFLGQAQTAYPRKNWSSVMLFDCAQCGALTPEYVNTATGLQLHRFQWLRDDQIGFLPLSWNHLVGEYPPNPTAKNLHYTLGGPWFPDFEDCDHADLWRAARDRMLGLVPRA